MNEIEQAEELKPVDPALLMPPGVVVEEPGARGNAIFEPNVTGIVGYGELDRARHTPAFEQLAALAADRFQVGAQQILLFNGRVCEGGTVAMFGMHTTPSAQAEPDRWIVASWTANMPSGHKPFFVTSWPRKDSAQASFDRRVAKLEA